MTATDAEIISLLRAGSTNEDAAFALGTSHRRAARLRREIGLPVTPKRGRLVLTPEQEARAHQLHHGEGLSWPVIGRRLGVGPDAARAAAKRYEEGRA